MTQTDNNNSYFSLKNPAINNKPQSTTTSVNYQVTPTIVKSGLLNRRQQAYLQPLELPSLPPVSQLLPNKTKTTTDAASVATSNMMADVSYSQQQQPKHNGLCNHRFNTTTHNCTTYSTAIAPTVATPHMTQLMDPAAVVAAAVAANLPLDNIYNIQPAAVASVDQISTTVPPSSSMYLSNYDPLMLQPRQPQVQPHNHNYNQHKHQHHHPQRTRQLSSSSTSSAEKQYSFVAIPGTNQKKRPRRRYDEIERLYHCSWAGCSKAYGTLNHLNAHVSMQKHGPKRYPTEFKEMRKLWRKQKKEREAHKKRNEEVNKQHMINQVSPAAATQQQQPPFTFNNLPVNGFY